MWRGLKAMPIPNNDDWVTRDGLIGGGPRVVSFATP
jgi:hypothetical protein